MKTASEILTEIHPKPINGDLQYAWVIQSMKVYANQKLDEAAKKAKYKYIEINGHLGSSIIEESILSLKDQI